MKFYEPYIKIFFLCCALFFVFHRVFVATDEQIRLRLRIGLQLEDQVDTIGPTSPNKIGILSFPKSACANQTKEIDIVCYVIVRNDDFQVREAIRDTWGDKKKISFANVIFVIGKSHDKSFNKKIMDENEKFGDLLIIDLLDTFKNLSFKSILAWKWMSENCQDTKVYIKASPYILVNFESIRKSLKINMFQNKSIFCRVVFGEKVDRIKSSLYYTSYRDYPRDFYPKYCQNQGTIISKDLLAKFYEKSKENKNVRLDDINMGIIADSLKASYQNSDGKHLNFKFFKPNKKNFDNYFFIYGLKDARNIKDSWRNIFK